MSLDSGANGTMPVHHDTLDARADLAKLGAELDFARLALRSGTRERDRLRAGITKLVEAVQEYHGDDEEFCDNLDAALEALLDGTR